MKVYVCGSIAVEHAGRALGERALPGRQGRRGFAYLVLHRRRGVLNEELAEAIWGETLPAAWESGLSVLVSKIRREFTRLGVDARRVLPSAMGAYQFVAPGDAWIDIDATVDYVERANREWRAGRAEAAYGFASAAWATTHAPFLLGDDAGWIRETRERLEHLHLQVLDTFIAYHRLHGDPAKAIAYAVEMLRINAIRESAVQSLMRLYAEAGNRAEALATYHTCRATLADELGVDPAPETQALFEAIVRSQPLPKTTE